MQASRTTRSRFTTSQCLPEGQASAQPRIDAVARLAPVVLVVALLAATAAAFAFAQRAKLEESPIQGIRFERRLLSPVCTACDPSAQVPIRFRLLNEDHVTVDIVDSSDAIVRERLLSGRYDPRSVLFSWDGRDGEGRVVADGLYRLRITLADEGARSRFPTRSVSTARRPRSRTSRCVRA